MKKIFSLLSILVEMLLLASCGIFKSASPTPTWPPTATQTPAILLIPTHAASPTPETPTATLPPLSTNTPAPFQPIKASITVDNFKLRVGPGFLFDAVALYDSNTSVLVMGRAPGDNWYFVQTENNRSGWMKMEYLDLAGDPATLPYISPTDVQTIVGHVRTKDTGAFASGIGVMLSPQSGYNGTNGDNALTDANGTFYLYEPKRMEGEYFIELNGYNCEGNLIVGRCELPYNFPIAQPLTLPMTTGVTIEFVLIPR